MKFAVKATRETAPRSGAPLFELYIDDALVTRCSEYYSNELLSKDEIRKIIEERISHARKLNDQYPHLQTPDGESILIKILIDLKNRLGL